MSFSKRSLKNLSREVYKTIYDPPYQSLTLTERSRSYYKGLSIGLEMDRAAQLERIRQKIRSKKQDRSAKLKRKPSDITSSQTNRGDLHREGGLHKEEAFRESPPTSQDKKGKKPHITLFMIVKNEAAIIRRCLDAAKAVFHTASIVDTGSTDDTVQILEAWKRENQVDMTIHHLPFVSFSYNRMHSYLMAKESYPQTDYFLTIDADQILEDTGYNPKFLVDEYHMLKQYNFHMDWWNVRFLSAKVPWQCVMHTHEFWRPDPTYLGPQVRSKFSGLVLNDIGDGGAKDGCLERDERLLKRTVAEIDAETYEPDPNNVDIRGDTMILKRVLYYLGNTLRRAGRYEEAILTYKRRIEPLPIEKAYLFDPEEEYVCRQYLGETYEARAWEIKTYVKTGRDTNEIDLGELETLPTSLFNATEQISQAGRLDQFQSIFTSLNIHQLSAPLTLTEETEDKEIEVSNEEVLKEYLLTLPETEVPTLNTEEVNLRLKFLQEKAWADRVNPDNLSLEDLTLKSQLYFDLAFKTYMDAYRFRPIRAEALYNAAYLCRRLEFFDQCYDLCQIGKKIPYPEKDGLEVARPCYEYFFITEIAWLGIACPKYREAGKQACEIVLTIMDKMTPVQQEMSRSIARFYNGN